MSQIQRLVNKSRDLISYDDKKLAKLSVQLQNAVYAIKMIRRLSSIENLELLQTSIINANDCLKEFNTTIKK